MDADGNTTATGTGQVYAWDGENRLISIEPLVPTTGDKKQLNVYDAQSRRVRKQVSTYSSGTWSLTTDEKFIYDGWNLAAKYDAQVSGLSLQVSYTWGTDLSGSLQGAGGVGGLLSAKDGSSVYHYTYDANGNVSEVLNSSSGIAAHYEYDAFGNTVASSGTYATTNAYRFSTKPLDDVSGLYYYGLRYYNPSTGRWPNRDPIAEKGGLNLLAFCANNGINFVDVNGCGIKACGKAIANLLSELYMLQKRLREADTDLKGTGLDKGHKRSINQEKGRVEDALARVIIECTCPNFPGLEEAKSKAQGLLDRAGEYLNEFAAQVRNSPGNDPWGDAAAAGAGGAFGLASWSSALAY